MNDTTKPSEYLGYWGEKYKNDLLTDILPFWLKYGIDHENGGYFTCLDRDGSLLDTNKSVWFQGRFAFIIRGNTKSKTNYTYDIDIQQIKEDRKKYEKSQCFPFASHFGLKRG